MANDSVSASSKIKELVRLYRLGVLSDEEYHDQLKSQIIIHSDDERSQEYPKKSFEKKKEKV
jgi:hypothetical protein